MATVTPVIVFLILSLFCNSNRAFEPYPFHLLPSSSSNNILSVELRPTKTVNIITRDGIKLATDYYIPRDATLPLPTIYDKTPYGKSSLADTNAEYWVGLGYAFVGQDMRGRYDSTGDFSFWRLCGNDTVDTLQWLHKQNWTNDLIGVYGISADAMAEYTGFSGITDYYNQANSAEYTNVMNHIKVGGLMVATALGREAVYWGGAYREALIDGWLYQIGEDSYITTTLEHEIFDTKSKTGDLYWEPLSGIYQNQWDVLNYSVVHFPGFYDIFSTLHIRTAMHMNESSKSSAANGQQILLVGPGGHCGGGAIDWPNASFQTDNDVLPTVFAAAFKAAERNEVFDVHKYVDYNVLFYFLGPGQRTGSLHYEEGNYYVQGLSFPEYTNKSWYLSNDNALIADTNQVKEDMLSFVYNPENPMRTFGGNNLIIGPCGPQDQRDVEKDRNDILHFESGVLDDYVALVGMITVDLFVSSNVTDTDFTAKVVDIFPNGEHMLVQDGIVRMRWRNGINTDVSPGMKTNEIYNISIEIGFMSYSFNPGHVISLSLSSSNYPRFSRNWNSGNMVIDGPLGWRMAGNNIHFGGGYPSKLTLPVVDMQWIQNHRH